MSTIVTSFITISCDNKDCQHTVTFPQTQEGEQEALRDNPWMNSLRMVQLVGQENKKFIYCCDECEIKATATGVHNKAVIVTPNAPNAVQLAAQAAARAQQATQQIKAGGPVTLE